MFGSTLIAIIVFGCMFAISVFGFVKSSASADRYSARRRHGTEPREAGEINPTNVGRL
jgi:hypothetical protein